MACPWRSSLLPRARTCSRSRRSPRIWAIAFVSSAPGAGSPTPGTRRFGRRWTGATSFSPRKSARCWGVCPCSRAGSAWTRWPRCALAVMRYRRWSLSAVSLSPRWLSPGNGTAGRGTGSWRRSASTRPSASKRPARSRRSAADTPSILSRSRKARWHGVRFEWQRQKEGLAVLDLERDNLHAAVQWTLDRGNELALPLTAALYGYWLIRGDRRQGLAWLEQALALPPRDASPDRTEALSGAALLARLVGDFARAQQFAE